MGTRRSPFSPGTKISVCPLTILASCEVSQSAFSCNRGYCSWFLRSCFGAPVYEELLYRLVFCTAMVALVGRWPAILLSGVVFAFLHVVYGVPSPDNFSAGFVFAWAFFRSGSILVPAVLHSLGNLCVVLFHLAYFWWTRS